MILNKENLHGNYTIIHGTVLRMYFSQQGWEIISNDISFERFGFIKKENYLYKIVHENQGISAFNIHTFCLYKNDKYEIGNIVRNIVILSPELETKQKLGIYINDDRRFEIPYDEFLKDAEEIWEERSPINGFVFDVDPVYYKKKRDT
ncbi:MAG: hypothetical protein LBI82_03730 [Dysgonamonadaceae bacterium]|jgi:hypothetical protein|nr:hypothetical protein [Dysgonamonadaceae bacterium]